jgi:hypothetical protein
MLVCTSIYWFIPVHTSTYCYILTGECVYVQGIYCNLQLSARLPGLSWTPAAALSHVRLPESGESLSARALAPHRDWHHLKPLALANPRRLTLVPLRRSCRMVSCRPLGSPRHCPTGAQTPLFEATGWARRRRRAPPVARACRSGFLLTSPCGVAPSMCWGRLDAIDAVEHRLEYCVWAAHSRLWRARRGGARPAWAPSFHGSQSRPGALPSRESGRSLRPGRRRPERKYGGLRQCSTEQQFS